MFFVKEILEEVKRNNGYIGKKARKSDKPDFPIEALDTFIYKEDKAISKVVEQINEGIDVNVYKKISYKPITGWLKLNGFLKEEYNQELGKTVTIPTEEGIQLGIRAERKSNSRGMEYMLVIYGRQAQEYIVQNMEKILYGEIPEE